MIKKLLIVFLLVLLTNPYPVSGLTYFSSADFFDGEGSTYTDAKTFVNRALVMEILDSNIMVACFDYDKDVGNGPVYDACFAASQQDFDDCAAYDSWLNSMGYNYDSYPEGQNMPVSSAKSIYADAVYYKNCDGLGGGEGYGVVHKQYFVFFHKMYDCDGGVPSWYTYDAEGYNSSMYFDYNDEISCPPYKKCSEDDDDYPVYTYDGTIPNPCRTDDGSTSNYACDYGSDCWSNDCSGSKTENKYVCVSDGGNGYVDWYLPWYDTCGGDGYSGSWFDETTLYCSVQAGSGYVCDSNHDEQVVESPSTPPSPCRKNIAESCSVTADCWNDDGGNWCNSISECTDGANGRDCGSDSDCTLGRCDSTCMDKLADGQSCDEDSDCINGYCGSGICGGITCDGTIEVNTEDNSGSPLSSLSVYYNGVFNGSTTGIGQKIIKLNNVDCGSSHNVTVKCSDNTTLCGIKSTQIDINNDEDYLNFDCTMCSSTNDLYFSQSDVNVSVNKSMVNVTVHSAGITSNVVVALYREDSDGIIDSQNIFSQTISVTAGSVRSANFNLSTLLPTDFLHIYIDSNNAVKNEIETNNYVFRAAAKPVKAYIDVKTQASFLNDLIKEYVSTFVESVSSVSQADIVIIVGHPKASGFDRSFDYMNSIVSPKGKIMNPYGGVVTRGSFDNDYSGKPEILAYGNRIDGELAAVKRMVNARNIFLEKNSESYTSYIDDLDTFGISIYDSLHTAEASTYYNKNNSAFRDKVHDILFDNNFEVAVKPVMTREGTSYGANTTLRVKNVNSDFSADYKDAIGISDKPIVLSRGLWSNLLSWEDFGKELTAEGHDVWLIEITGGPEQDCPTCPNYNYDDLKDYYWPTLIAGVQEYSGQNMIDYIGFSNGCRVGLSSLESYSSSGKNNAGYYFDYNTGKYLYSDLAANSVDTFIGMGCPGNFSGNSLFAECFGEYGQDVTDYFETNGITHPTQRQIANQLAKEAPFYSSCNYLNQILKSEGRISENLGEQYYNWIVNNPSTQPGENSNMNKYVSIYGTNGFLNDDTNDYLVSEEDQLGILDAVNSSIKRNYSKHLRHNQLPNDAELREIIMEELK